MWWWWLNYNVNLLNATDFTPKNGQMVNFMFLYKKKIDSSQIAEALSIAIYLPCHPQECSDIMSSCALSSTKSKIVQEPNFEHLWEKGSY